jgi:hypothetical protein
MRSSWSYVLYALYVIYDTTGCLNSIYFNVISRYKLHHHLYKKVIILNYILGGVAGCEGLECGHQIIIQYICGFEEIVQVSNTKLRRRH